MQVFADSDWAAPPDLAALLFRNGELIDTYKGAHFSTGGLANALKGVVGGSTHIAIMLADLKPFQAELPVRGMSRDNVEISGLATLELQLNPEKPSNILGLMSGVARNQASKTPLPGRKALSRVDVLNRIAPHFEDRVVEAVLGQMDAADIRGEVGLQDKIQADMMLEAERICGDIGVLVRAVSVTWNMNAVEHEAFIRAQIDRQQDAMDYQLDLLKRQIDRQQESAEVKITSEVDLAKLQAAGEDDLAHMVLQSEIAFIDAREEATRRQEMEALAHEIEVMRVERSAKMEENLAQAAHTIDITQAEARLRTVQNDMDKLDQTHLAEMKKLGAYTDSEIIERQTRMDVELKALRERTDLETANIAQQQAAANLRTVTGIEQDNEDRSSDRVLKEQKAQTDNTIALKKADTDARLAHLQAGSKMSPEQIMAINAGFSPEVAEVLKEQARANATAGQSSMDAMRELIKGAAEERAMDRQHQLDILKAGMAGATGVAHGAGGKEDGADLSDLGATSPAITECPKCGREVAAKDKFCLGCGHKLRT